MKIFFTATSLLFLVVVCPMVIVRSQSPMPAPPFGPTHVGGDERPDAPTKDDFRRVPHPQRQLGPMREKRVLKKGLLAPTAQDISENAAFLQLRDRGLIKLLPREIFDWGTYEIPKRVKVRGGGAYYSFFYISHDNVYGADIELDHNFISLDFKAPDYGMLMEVGHLPLTDLSADDPRTAFIAAYKPASSRADALCEIKRLRNGLEMNGSLYKLSLPVKVNSTYLLRSINYGRSDLLVGFRVTRQDRDGSVIIAWRLLKQYWRPTFERVVYVNPIDKCPTK